MAKKSKNEEKKVLDEIIVEESSEASVTAEESTPEEAPKMPEEIEDAPEVKKGRLEEKIRKIKEYQAERMVDKTLMNRDVQEKIKRYASEMQTYLEDVNRSFLNSYYDGWLKGDAPLLNALTQGFVTVYSLGAKVLDSGIIEYSLNSKSITIDIVDFGNYVKDRSIFNSGGWIHKLEALHYWIGLRSCELHDAENIADFKAKHIHQYIASKHEFDIELATSKTKLRDALQIIVDDVIFVDNGKGENVYKVLTRHAQYMTDVYSNGVAHRTKLSHIRMDKMIMFFTIMLHSIIVNKNISVDFENGK